MVKQEARTKDIGTQNASKGTDPFLVAALYKFVPLPDYREFRVLKYVPEALA